MIPLGILSYKNSEGGSGTIGDPFLIYTVEELLAIEGKSNCYRLCNNLDLTGVGNSSSIAMSVITSFSGVFDGGGFTLSNYNPPSISCMTSGFISEINMSKAYTFNYPVIRNLHLDNFTITQGSAHSTLTARWGICVGGVAGTIIGLTDYSCIDNVKITNSTNDQRGGVFRETCNIGMIAAYVYQGRGNITNCIVDDTNLIMSNDTRYTSNNFGGIAGQMGTNTIIDRCMSGCRMEISSGGFNILNTVGGICYRGTVRNSCYIGTIDNANFADKVSPMGISSAKEFVYSVPTFLNCASTKYAHTGTTLGGTGYSTCYINIDSGYDTVQEADINPKTSLEMQSQATYVGWDFTDIWGINPTKNGGFPYILAIDQFIWGKPYNGLGTSTNPYIIMNLGDFTYIRKEPTAYYKLGADIDLNYTSPLDGITFGGNLNGDGYTISNFYKEYTVGGTISNGIFPICSGTGRKISNLRIDNSHIISKGNSTSGSHSTGILAGKAIDYYFENIIIENSSILPDPIATSQSNGMIGGLVGQTGTSRSGGVAYLINDVYIADTVTLSAVFTSSGSVPSVGGVAGGIYSGWGLPTCFRRVYVAATVGVAGAYGNYSCGVNSSAQRANYEDCAIRVNLIYESINGLATTYSTPNMRRVYSVITTDSGTPNAFGDYVRTPSNGPSCYVDTELNPVTINETNVNSKTTLEMKTQSTYMDTDGVTPWNFTTTWGINPLVNNGYPYLRAIKEYAWKNATLCGSGSGTEADPYLICDLTTFGFVAIIPTAFFKMIANIDLNFTSPLDGVDFSGGFDGNGYTLSNFYKEYTLTGVGTIYNGIFPICNSPGYIKNLRVDNAHIVVKGDSTSGSHHTGILSGHVIDFILNNIKIQNSSITSDVAATSQSSGYIGGLAGTIGVSGYSDRELINTIYIDSSVTIRMLSASLGGSLPHIGGLLGAITSFNGRSVLVKKAHVSANVGIFGGNPTLTGGIIGSANGAGYAYCDLSDCIVAANMTDSAVNGAFNSGNNPIMRRLYSIVTTDVGILYPFGDTVKTPINGASCYVDTEISTMTIQETNVNPKSTAQMKTQGTYLDTDGITSWDFVGTWGIDPLINNGYPYLRSIEEYVWKQFVSIVPPVDPPVEETDALVILANGDTVFWIDAQENVTKDVNNFVSIIRDKTNLGFGVDLVSGWDFTVGWGVLGTPTITSSSSFTGDPLAASGITAPTVIFEVGEAYRLRCIGTISSGDLQIKTGHPNGDIIATVNGSFDIDILFIVNLTDAANFYFRAVTGGDVAISFFVIEKALGHPLTQKDSTRRPTWSLNGILFNGSNNFMKTHNFSLIQPEEIYIVFKQITWTGADYIFDGSTNPSGSFFQTTSGVSPDIKINAGVTGVINSNLPLDTLAIVTILFDGPSSYLQVNETIPSASNVGYNNMNGFVLGSWSGVNGNFSNIEVQEVIIRKVVSTPTIKATIYSHLKAKYGIV